MNNGTIGRKITFISSGRGGFTNGLTGGNLRSVTVTGDPAISGMKTHTDPSGAVNKFNVVYGGSKYILAQIFNAASGSVPAIQYDYDTLWRVKEAKDAVALQVGGRNPYQFFIGEGVRSERVDPAGGEYAVFYDDKKRAIGFLDELGRSISASYDGRGRVTEYVYPESDRELLEYDGRNNVKKITRMPKGCGGTNTRFLHPGRPGYPGGLERHLEQTELHHRCARQPDRLYLLRERQRQIADAHRDTARAGVWRRATCLHVHIQRSGSVARRN